MFIRTNIVLDEKKLKAAKAITHIETTKDVVDYALTRLTKTAKAFSELNRLKGKVRFLKNYNYKKNR